jgi:hypothetical protein
VNVHAWFSSFEASRSASEAVTRYRECEFATVFYSPRAQEVLATLPRTF